MQVFERSDAPHAMRVYGVVAQMAIILPLAIHLQWLREGQTSRLSNISEDAGTRTRRYRALYAAVAFLRYLTVAAVPTAALAPFYICTPTLVGFGYIVWILLLAVSGYVADSSEVGWDSMHGHLWIWKALLLYSGSVVLAHFCWQILATENLPSLGLFRTSSDMCATTWPHMAIVVLAAIQVRIMQIVGHQPHLFIRCDLSAVKQTIRFLTGVGVFVEMGLLFTVVFLEPVCLDSLMFLLLCLTMVANVQFRFSRSQRQATFLAITVVAGAVVPLRYISLIPKVSDFLADRKDGFDSFPLNTLAIQEYKQAPHNIVKMYFTLALILFSCFLHRAYRHFGTDVVGWTFLSNWHRAQLVLRFAARYSTNGLLFMSYFLMVFKEDLLFRIQLVILTFISMSGRMWTISGAVLSVSSMVLLLTQYLFMFYNVLDPKLAEYIGLPVRREDAASGEQRLEVQSNAVMYIMLMSLSIVQGAIQRMHDDVEQSYKKTAPIWAKIDAKVRGDAGKMGVIKKIGNKEDGLPWEIHWEDGTAASHVEWAQLYKKCGRIFEASWAQILQTEVVRCSSQMGAVCMLAVAVIHRNVWAAVATLIVLLYVLLGQCERQDVPSLEQRLSNFRRLHAKRASVWLFVMALVLEADLLYGWAMQLWFPPTFHIDRLTGDDISKWWVCTTFDDGYIHGIDGLTQRQRCGKMWCEWLEISLANRAASHYQEIFVFLIFSLICMLRNLCLHEQDALERKYEGTVSRGTCWCCPLWRRLAHTSSRSRSHSMSSFSSLSVGSVENCIESRTRGLQTLSSVNAELDEIAESDIEDVTYIKDARAPLVFRVTAALLWISLLASAIYADSLSTTVSVVNIFLFFRHVTAVEWNREYAEQRCATRRIRMFNLAVVSTYILSQIPSTPCPMGLKVGDSHTNFIDDELCVKLQKFEPDSGPKQDGVSQSPLSIFLQCIGFRRITHYYTFDACLFWNLVVFATAMFHDLARNRWSCVLKDHIIKQRERILKRRRAYIEHVRSWRLMEISSIDVKQHVLHRKLDNLMERLNELRDLWSSRRRASSGDLGTQTKYIVVNCEKLPERKVPVFASVDSQDVLEDEELCANDSVRAAGIEQPRTSDGSIMLPIKPRGAVQLKYLASEDRILEICLQCGCSMEEVGEVVKEFDDAASKELDKCIKNSQEQSIGKDHGNFKRQMECIVDAAVLQYMEVLDLKKTNKITEEQRRARKGERLDDVGTEICKLVGQTNPDGTTLNDDSANDLTPRSAGVDAPPQGTVVALGTSTQQGESMPSCSGSEVDAAQEGTDEDLLQFCSCTSRLWHYFEHCWICFSNGTKYFLKIYAIDNVLFMQDRAEETLWTHLDNNSLMRYVWKALKSQTLLLLIIASMFQFINYQSILSIVTVSSAILSLMAFPHAPPLLWKLLKWYNVSVIALKIGFQLRFFCSDGSISFSGCSVERESGLSFYLPIPALLGLIKTSHPLIVKTHAQRYRQASNFSMVANSLWDIVWADLIVCLLVFVHWHLQYHSGRACNPGDVCKQLTASDDRHEDTAHVGRENESSEQESLSQYSEQLHSIPSQNWRDMPTAMTENWFAGFQKQITGTAGMRKPAKDLYLVRVLTTCCLLAMSVFGWSNLGHTGRTFSASLQSSYFSREQVLYVIFFLVVIVTDRALYTCMYKDSNFSDKDELAVTNTPSRAPLRDLAPSENIGKRIFDVRIIAVVVQKILLIAQLIFLHGRYIYQWVSIVPARPEEACLLHAGNFYLIMFYCLYMMYLGLTSWQIKYQIHMTQGGLGFTHYPDLGSFFPIQGVLPHSFRGRASSFNRLERYKNVSRFFHVDEA
jgi:hypothetical protein